MKNQRSLIIDAIEKAGYEFVRNTKHGTLYHKEGKKDVVVPRRVRAKKIVQNADHRLGRNEL